MKIRNGIGESNDDAIKITRQDSRGVQHQNAKANDKTNVLAYSKGKDSVSTRLSVSRAIQQELDPAAMLAERKNRVEELKKLIKNGEYNPPIMDVARAVNDEIGFEILAAGSSGQSEAE